MATKGNVASVNIEKSVEAVVPGPMKAEGTTCTKSLIAFMNPITYEPF
jgi:hypothetical protein